LILNNNFDFSDRTKALFQPFFGARLVRAAKSHFVPGANVAAVGLLACGGALFRALGVISNSKRSLPPRFRLGRNAPCAFLPAPTVGLG